MPLTINRKRMQHLAALPTACSTQQAARSTEHPEMIFRHDVARKIASAQNLPQKVATNKQSSATQRANGVSVSSSSPHPGRQTASSGVDWRQQLDANW